MGDVDESSKYPPSVVAKMDVEGRELDIIPDLVMSGALQHIDNLHVDWTRMSISDEHLLDQLSAAMSLLTTLGTERGLAHTTEILSLDDESYWDFDGPLP